MVVLAALLGLAQHLQVPIQGGARSDTSTAAPTDSTVTAVRWVFVDSYHDRRTGYEFGVNAAGVKMDQAIYDDNEFKGSESLSSRGQSR